MKKFKLAFAVFLFCSVWGVNIVGAQGNSELEMRLSRDFGYAAGGDIQGNFSMRVSGPENLERVDYYLDGELIGESSESPSFRFRFSTDSFPLGVHTMSAIGYTTDGEVLESNEIRRNFISANEGTQAAIKIVGIILGLVIGVSLLSYAVTTLAGGKRKSSVEPGAARNYGPLGGTICPKCGRPFSRHVWGLNMVVGKFDRCPHCGNWSMTQRASLSELRAAELAELDQVDKETFKPILDDEERLRKDLEDSRFNDL